MGTRLGGLISLLIAFLWLVVAGLRMDRSFVSGPLIPLVAAVVFLVAGLLLLRKAANEARRPPPD